ncbi:MAG TPA: methyltransferase [Casimicrobiaceae bacterium]
MTRRAFAARLATALAACAIVAGCATPASQPDASLAAHYAQVVADPVRSAPDRANDAERHPAQLLAFAGVAPGMRVLDVSAGAGYTSALLALAVGPQGRVYAQAPHPGAALQQRVADHPGTNIEVVARPFDDPVPPQVRDLDLVTLIQNYHDISYLPVDRGAMNAHLFAALRHGGHYVVIDHSARPGTGIADGRTLHRIDENVVLEEAKRAGFVLEAEGDFLRNPADTRDTPSTRATIPTDKFALRFVKP